MQKELVLYTKYICDFLSVLFLKRWCGIYWTKGIEMFHETMHCIFLLAAMYMAV